MGSACCCLRDECEDLANPNSSIYRNCICLRCFIQNFMHMYVSLFHRGEDHHALTSSNQGTTPVTPMTSLDNSLADMYRSPPRPLPYDADTRYFRLQRGLVSRRDKGSSHSHDETEPLRTIEADDDESESFGGKNKKWNEFMRDEDESKEYNSRLSIKLSSAKGTTGFSHIYTSSDDEDVCPTCLEEYTVENPKINTKCCHHFHLGCIYEWMERSDNCPVCGQVMAFDETP
ncbi:RING/U-box superfamily protein [Striga hermonthica]|uniref:RING-type E3 ubiquitin transferase n=1 Tax=Striga hermonthica TaxID=68872 RepID=A0A9N7N1E0_STRHE|nr:RING/U-box superfamily protein [Striga hermonthica]